MQDRFIAAQLANAVVDNLQKFVVKYRTGKAMENVQYYERVYEEIHDDYLKAQRKYADYVDSHLGSMSQSSKVRGIFLQNEAQLKYQMYNSTAQNLLAAKAKVQQESPVLVVLQQAMPPYKGKPSLSNLAIAFLLIGAVAGFIVEALPKKE